MFVFQFKRLWTFGPVQSVCVQFPQKYNFTTVFNIYNNNNNNNNNNKTFLEQKIRILEWFHYHLTLKTGVMAAENSALLTWHKNKLHFKIE